MALTKPKTFQPRWTIYEYPLRRYRSRWSLRSISSVILAKCLFRMNSCAGPWNFPNTAVIREFSQETGTFPPGFRLFGITRIMLHTCNNIIIIINPMSRRALYMFATDDVFGSVF